MTDDNLGQELDDSIAEFQRTVTVINLGKRAYLTIEQLVKLVGHPQHGETVKGISLQELLDVQKRIEAGEDVTPTVPPQKTTKSAPDTPKKATKKATAKKTAKKATKKATAKKATKKATKKAAVKKTAVKKTAKKSAKKATAKKAAKKASSKSSEDKPEGDGKRQPKADKGKPKPRLDYATGTREVLAAIKAGGAPMGRSDIEQATGYTGVQVRAFCKKLQKEGKIEIQGTGGRSTLYAMPGMSAG